MATQAGARDTQLPWHHQAAHTTRRACALRRDPRSWGRVLLYGSVESRPPHRAFPPRARGVLARPHLRIDVSDGSARDGLEHEDLLSVLLRELLRERVAASAGRVSCKRRVNSTSCALELQARQQWHAHARHGRRLASSVTCAAAETVSGGTRSGATNPRTRRRGGLRGWAGGYRASLPASSRTATPMTPL